MDGVYNDDDDDVDDEIKNNEVECIQKLVFSYHRTVAIYISKFHYCNCIYQSTKYPMHTGCFLKHNISNYFKKSSVLYKY